MKNLIKTLIALSFLAILIAAGCESRALTGAAVGSAAGAGIGQLAGRNTESTLIGGAVGGGLGYIIGNEADKKAERQAMNEQMNTVTVYVTNSNGSIIAVNLHRQGPGFVGPRGEYYNSLPTESQLRPVYGF
jgi:hypothetical protein